MFDLNVATLRLKQRYLDRVFGVSPSDRGATLNVVFSDDGGKTRLRMESTLKTFDLDLRGLPSVCLEECFVEARTLARIHARRIARTASTRSR